METQELLTRYQAGIRKFVWADLKNANLADANLAEVNLSQANLSGAILTGANLTKVNLYKANLSQANLLGADLTDANLRKVNFEGAIMPDGSSYEEWEKKQLAADIVGDETDELSVGEEEDDSEEKKEEEGIAFVSSFKREPQRPTRVKAKYFWKVLPKQRLLSLGFGYCLFGQMLTYFKAPPLAWLLAFLGSIIWVVRESWFWFVPLVPALAIIGTAGISIVGLGVSLAVSQGYIAGGLGMFKTRQVVRDGIWIGGILLSVFFVINLLTFSDNFSLALLFVGAIASVSYGMFAFGEMERIGYSKKQIINTFIATTAAGLFLGGLVAMVF